MGLTFQLEDEVTGELVWVTIYVRGGKHVLQRLPPHLQPENASRARLEQLARFGLASHSVFGTRGSVGGLHPAAAAVRTACSGGGHSDETCPPPTQPDPDWPSIRGNRLEEGRPPEGDSGDPPQPRRTPPKAPEERDATLGGESSDRSPRKAAPDPIPGFLMEPQGFPPWPPRRRRHRRSE
jgi:hypothetical protein